MSALKNFFSNSFETSDNGQQVELTTHYYANDYEKVKYSLVNICKNFGFEIENINDNYGEILVTKNKMEIVCTIFKKSYYLNSVDFKITSSYLIPMGRPVKMLKKIYEELNHQLTLKNIGGQQIG